MMFFIIPLAAAVVSACYFGFLADVDLKWKIIVPALVAGSVLVEFVPPIQVHFLIPLIIQALVAIAMLIHVKVG